MRCSAGPAARKPKHTSCKGQTGGSARRGWLRRRLSRLCCCCRGAARCRPSPLHRMPPCRPAGMPTHSHRHSPPLVCILLLSVALCNAVAPAVAALTTGEREAAFIGYSEQEASASRGAAGEEAPPCPADEHPQCAEWAEQGECLHNPSFMRSACKASCRVVARCVRGMASRAAGPWAGHATAAGTASWAAAAPGAKLRFSAGHFRQHLVRYSGAGRTQE